MTLYSILQTHFCCNMLHNAAVCSICSISEHKNENPWSIPYLFDAASKIEQLPQISFSFTYENLNELRQYRFLTCVIKNTKPPIFDNGSCLCGLECSEDWDFTVYLLYSFREAIYIVIRKNEFHLW